MPASDLRQDATASAAATGTDRLPRLRVAFVGKGGAGKSSLGGTLVRVLAARGEPVLALDSDPLPGLAYALGMARTDAGLPAEAVEERGEGEEGPPYRLPTGMTAADAVDRYAATGPDGVRFLQLGKVGGAADDVRGAHVVFRQIVRELAMSDWHLVGDLPGGTRQPFFGWGSYARTVLVVVDASPASLLSARRLRRLGTHGDAPPRVLAIANKVRGSGDVTRIAERTGLPIVAEIPHDEELVEAERSGVALIDHAPSSPVVGAVRSLLDLLLEGGEGA
jgi:CO dehydrogenase maturation factor